ASILLPQEAHAMTAFRSQLKEGYRRLFGVQQKLNQDLGQAARDGNVSAAVALLKQGAEINSNNVLNGRTPLIEAVRRGSLNMIKILLFYGANVNDFDDSGSGVLMNTIFTFKDTAPQLLIDIAQELLDAGANPNERSRHTGNAVLIEAIQERLPDMVKILLRYGADPDTPTFSKNTPLITAAMCSKFDPNSTNIAQELLNAKADVNGKGY